MIFKRREIEQREQTDGYHSNTQGSFAGIILFAVWLILLAFRKVIPEYFISELNMRTNYPAGYVMADKITTGPDGNLWFTESNTNQIGKFSPVNNKITEYNVPLSGTTNTDPDSITVGPDGICGSPRDLKTKSVSCLQRVVKLRFTMYPPQMPPWAISLPVPMVTCGSQRSRETKSAKFLR